MARLIAIRYFEHNYFTCDGMINCYSLHQAQLFHMRRHDHLLFITSSALISHAKTRLIAIQYLELNYSSCDGMINCYTIYQAQLYHMRWHDYLLFITTSAIISHARARSLAIRYIEHNYYKFNKRNDKSDGSTIKSFCHGSRKEKLFQSCRSSLYDPACSQSIHP